MKPHWVRLSNKMAFSLLEFIVALTIASFVILGSYSLYNTHIRSSSRALSRATDLIAFKNAVNQIARDIEYAGHNPSPSVPLDKLVTATSTQIKMQSDFNEDGALTDDNELIEYNYDATTGTITTSRKQGDPLNTTTPFLSNVTAFSLTYYSVLTGEDPTDPEDNIGLTKNAADFEPLIQKIGLTVSMQTPDMGNPAKTKTITAKRYIFPQNLMY